MFKWPKNQILNAILSFRSSGMSGHSTCGIYIAQILLKLIFMIHFEIILNQFWHVYVFLVLGL